MRQQLPAALAALALTVTGTVLGIQDAGPGTSLRTINEVTMSQNDSRDGWDPAEPLLSPAAVASKSFGQVFDTKVNGQVYAQPLAVGGSVLVATENDYVYSINRNTGAVNWSTQLGTPYAAAAEDCKQAPVVQPYIGVTSTPVYDPATGTLYVSGMLSGPPGDDADLSTATPADYLFALDERTGAVEWRRPVEGSPASSPNITFSAAKQLQRAGLLLLNGSVYLGFGALCADGAPDHDYVGFIAGVNTRTRAETLWSDEPSSDDTYGGIWQGGGGLLTDGKSIYFSTGNGTAPPLATPGGAAPALASLGQSLVKLNIGRNGSLRPADFFSPGDASRMDATDHDFGSGGPIMLPFGTRAYPHLLATADKEAVVYLLNQASLGGSSASPGGSTAVFTSSPGLVGNPSTTDYGSLADVEHGLWGHMAAFAGASPGPGRAPDDYLYYQGAGWGSSGPMDVLRFDGSNPARPVLVNAGRTALQFGFSSGSPDVTSNGTSTASAIVWEVYAGDETGEYGSLNAYLAQPAAAGRLRKIWSAPIGNAGQFTVPATSDGRVYVGARNDATSAPEGTNATTCPTDFESAAYTSTDSGCVGEVHGFGILSEQLSGPEGTPATGPPPWQARP